MAISKHLKEMMDKLPRGVEFMVDDLSPAIIYRAAWVVKRLVEEGVLEQRVEWKNPDNFWAGTISYYIFKNNE